MRPETVAGLVRRWTRLYTRGLPSEVAERRTAEIDADLHDHVVHERESGVPERRIAARLATRALRGAPADASWRTEIRARRPAPPRGARMSPDARSAARVAAVTAAVLLVPAIATATGGADWSLFDFALAAALLLGAGMLLDLAVRRPGGVVLRVTAAGIGVAAMALGEADDAPGLVGFGLLLVLAAVALSVRTVRRV